MGTLRITGEITALSASTFARDLAAQEGVPVRVLVNSEGGDVQAGLEMYEALHSYPGETVAVIESLAASMASIVVLAADRIEMYKDARYMIHPPETMPGILYGERDTADNLEARAEELRKIESTLLRIYTDHSTLEGDALRALWAKEPYLTADEAKGYGFVDAILDGSPDVKSVAAIRLRANAPHPLVRMVAKAKNTGVHAMSEEEMKALRAKLGLADTASVADIMSALDVLKAESAESAPEEAPPSEEEEFAAAVATLPAKFQAKILSQMAGQGNESRETLLAKVPEALRAFASRLSVAALQEYVTLQGRILDPAKAKTSPTAAGAKTGKTDEELRVIAKAQAKAGLGSEQALFDLLKKGMK